VIVDEYLIAEKVLNRNRPMFFLFDMGSWTANNSTVKKKADSLDKMKQEMKEYLKTDFELEKAIYSSFNMTFN